MSMSENDGVFGNPQEITQDQAEAFRKIKELGEELKAKEGLHVGLKDELDRHKQTMEAIAELDRKVNLIIKHFNIVPIIGLSSGEQTYP